MKTVMALSLVAACALACNDKKTNDRDAVDQTRTTSAVIVEPTLHDGHAAEPENVDQNRTEEAEQNEDLDKDVDRTDMSGVSRDGGESY
jgi:hypothetical protein